ncbi:zinc ABC transporter substrate-binding protein [Leptotrichia sp. OH3620_COT-345]|uniref:metal ABC transporter substrate-binding protein n=1 Tax=Leptotrichia sp. OH3620_COT-345 TaxID=2491048 RepID=UPI000F64EACF|nr:zinc ABC transporter substrate-binding protein [Leptotrichia sp. OH3620_COT-345]RRD39361.1 zinc ABC transporter substrate-binding protein [Leptotrichia sp. OH3620_COT-345]
MKKILTLILVGIFIFSCGKKESSGKKEDTIKTETTIKKEKIAASIPPLKWIVQKIAGNDFEVISIVQPNMNHELFDPKPDDLKVLEDSKIFFTYNMLAFEETVGKSLNNPDKVTNVLNGVDTALFLKGHHHDDDDHDHDHKNEKHGHKDEKNKKDDHNHDEDSLDPHVWFSLEMMPQVAKNIKDKLTEIYPDKKDVFEKNFNDFSVELNKFKDEISKKMASKTKKSFMIYHPALDYFLKNYDIEEIEIESEGKEPSAQQIKEIINEAKEHGVTTILVQPQFPKQSAEAISKEIPGSKVMEFNVDLENVFENLNRFVDYLD